jgi:hypothetical protein
MKHGWPSPTSLSPIQTAPMSSYSFSRNCPWEEQSGLVRPNPPSS